MVQSLPLGSGFVELQDVIGHRRMCRNFSDRPVPPATVDGLLDRARRSPSAGYSQGYGFVVLEEPGDRERFWSATSEPDWRVTPEAAGLMAAPVIVVPVCSAAVYVARYSEPDKAAFGLTTEAAWPVPFWTVDVSFATMVLLLGVTEEGLGALFFGFRTREAIEAFKSAFGVPGSWSPIGVVAMGWPAGDGGSRGSAVTRDRRPLSEVVHRGGW
jgi:nitroreductase